MFATCSCVGNLALIGVPRSIAPKEWKVVSVPDGENVVAGLALCGCYSARTSVLMARPYLICKVSLNINAQYYILIS